VTTPLQIAKANCANYQCDGSCLGCDIEKNGKISRCSPKLHCRLADTPPERCEYFEACVLPGRPEMEPMYRAHVNLPRREHRHCACGAVLPKRKRCCTECAIKRRRATYRASKRTSGKTMDGNSTFSQNYGTNSLGKSHGFSAVSLNGIDDGHHPQYRELSVESRVGAK